MLPEVVHESIPSSRALEARKGHGHGVTGLGQAGPDDRCWPFGEATTILQGWVFFPRSMDESWPARVHSVLPRASLSPWPRTRETCPC